MSSLYFREDLDLRQLVGLVCEVIGGRVGLYGELKLGDDLLVDGDLDDNIIDGQDVCEPGHDLDDPEPFFFVILDKFLDLVDSQDQVLHLGEDALPPDHVANLEGDLFLLLQNPANCFLEVLVLFVNSFLNAVLCLILKFLRIPEEHLLLDVHHGPFVGIAGVEP